MARPTTSNLNQARSQDFEKGGRLFWKSETTVSDLDPNFYCSWIRFKRFIRNWDGFFGRNRKFKRFFRPKTGDLQKKKTVFTEIETDFSAEIRNSNGFSGWITATPWQLLHPNSFGRGLFSFFEQKSASKALKTCDFAYFSGQWGGLEPPPPPPPFWLRYWLKCYQRYK